LVAEEHTYLKFVLYSTNGEVTWFHDVREELNRSRCVSGFHIPAAFDEMLTREFDRSPVVVTLEATWSSGPLVELAQSYEVGSQCRSLESAGRHRGSG